MGREETQISQTAQMTQKRQRATTSFSRKIVAALFSAASAIISDLCVPQGMRRLDLSHAPR
jgi:hypothetical protein